MESIPPTGPTDFGALPPDFGSQMPPGMPKGPLLPEDHPFVKAVTQMFSHSGGADAEKMRMVATQLLWEMEKSIESTIKHDSQVSRKRRREDLDELLGH